MSLSRDYQKLNCSACIKGEALGFDFSMAFQPIINIQSGEVFAYEALARGTGGESASNVFQHVNDSNLYRFDQTCRVKAIHLASQLGIPCFLSINFMPNAIYKPELCIRTTLAAATEYGFPHERIIFEFNEGERVIDPAHLLKIVKHYQELNLKVAIDDFGAGFAGLNLLADCVPDYIKLDMNLIRNVDSNSTRRSIVRHTVRMCEELGIVVIAEGIESESEALCLADFGIVLQQGYWFAKPAFEALPPSASHHRFGQASS